MWQGKRLLLTRGRKCLYSLVHDEVEQQLHAPLVDLLDEVVAILLGAVRLVNVLIVGNVVAL